MAMVVDIKILMAGIKTLMIMMIEPYSIQMEGGQHKSNDYTKEYMAQMEQVESSNSKIYNKSILDYAIE